MPTVTLVPFAQTKESWVAIGGAKIVERLAENSEKTFEPEAPSTLKGCQSKEAKGQSVRLGEEVGGKGSGTRVAWTPPAGATVTGIVWHIYCKTGNTSKLRLLTLEKAGSLLNLIGEVAVSKAASWNSFTFTAEQLKAFLEASAAWTGQQCDWENEKATTEAQRNEVYETYWVVTYTEGEEGSPLLTMIV